MRYAVVGLGWIAQTAVLPAFAHARRNSELVALVSDDARKLRELSRKYGVRRTATYAQFGKLLRSGAIDAVYIALPNDMHRDFTLRAAEARVHVLCEKPLAVTETSCLRMLERARARGVKLMTAYRLHFERANLTAIREVRRGRIGEPRIFSSTFSMQVADPDNIRLRDEHLGGGPVYDLGIYCINAARNLFGDEPIEVTAVGARNHQDTRFLECDEMVGAILRFPGDRIAQFVCSFGAGDTAAFDVIGTEGSLRLEQAYEIASPMTLRVRVGERRTKRRYTKRDQFAPELESFSDCILNDREPEPGGAEGLADVRVIEAILRSARRGRAVRLSAPLVLDTKKPSMRQESRKPPVGKQELVGITPPTN